MQQRFVFERLKANELLPANEINHIFQDRKGFIWVGAQNGLYRYDGYRVKQYRNTPEQPHVLASNIVRTIAQDAEGQLWVGTRKGLTMMTAHSEENEEHHFLDFPNSDIVNCILFTRSGDVWIGTEGGLYGKHRGKDADFTLYCDQKKNSKVPHCSVNSLMEDSEGYIWIGTWDKGLYRYSPHNGQFYEMPRFNDLGSAQALAEDHWGRLWVGTWGRGLFCITNPHDTRGPLQFRHFDTHSPSQALPSDIVWDITEDTRNHLLWVGTAKGPCLIPLDEGSERPLPLIEEPENGYFARGVKSMFTDRQGRMWLYAYERGIVSTSLLPPYFAIHQLSDPMRATDHITSLAYDTHNRLLVGTSHSGLLFMDEEGRSTPLPSRVNAILPGADNRLWVGTQRHGLYCLADGAIVSHADSEHSPWLADNCIYSIISDPQGNLLIGTWKGLSVRYADGRGIHIEGPSLRPLEQAQVTTLSISHPDTLWLGTNGMGIMRLTGNLCRPASLRLTSYQTLADTDFQVLNIYRVITDRMGRLWACSQESGLMLYDPELDGFRSISAQLGIPDDDMYSIETSPDGQLWLSSRHHLISVRVGQDGKATDLRFFDRKDVLLADHFSPSLSAVSPMGEMTFAGQYTQARFSQRDIPKAADGARPVVTDILVLGNSLLRNSASPLPSLITLQPRERDLCIQFSSLDLDNPDAVRYAYLLDGLDHEWHYTQVGQSQVNYSQLPPGTYTLRLRCTNQGGSWSREEQTLAIRVLPPLWQRWWAWLIYGLIILGIIALLLIYLRNRERQRHELWLAQTERQHAQTLLEEYKQQTEERVRQQLFADICGLPPSQSDEDFVTRCLDCVQQHIADPDFGLPRFAASMCMSKSSLYKKLRSASGLTTSAFIRTVRMRSARELLCHNPRARIADVAYAVGYSDPKYFSACFKHDFGLLPTEFAAQQKEA